MSPTREEDKTGDALKAQRFRMLEDIATEMSRKLVFPTCFDVTIRLRELLDDPDAPIEKISAAVSLDPMISSRLLSAANSVLNRRDGPPCKDLQSAIMRIGTKSVRSLALGIAMRQLLLAKDLTDFDGTSRRLWTHSVTTAAACSILAQKFGRVTADQALFAGLVHDLGASYMLYRAAQYDELRERPDTVRHLVYQWHESIGESLLFSLGIPEEIAIATRDRRAVTGVRVVTAATGATLGRIADAGVWLDAGVDYAWTLSTTPFATADEAATLEALRLLAGMRSLNAPLPVTAWAETNARHNVAAN